MDENKKVILINGKNSNWYEQVIFIVKEKNKNKVPENLAREAEKIINSHIQTKYFKDNNVINDATINNINPPQNAPKKIKKNNQTYSIRTLHIILNISIVCTAILVCFLLYQIFI